MLMKATSGLSQRFRYYGCRTPSCCIVTSMSAAIVIRLAKPSENDLVHALVQAIAD